MVYIYKKERDPGHRDDDHQHPGLPGHYDIL